MQVRKAGKNLQGVASVMAGPDDALADYIRYLEAQPAVARVAGVPLGDDGRADPAKVLEVLDYTVVVSIKLEGLSGESPGIGD